MNTASKMTKSNVEFCNRSGFKLFKDIQRHDNYFDIDDSYNTEEDFSPKKINQVGFMDIKMFEEVDEKPKKLIN